VRAVACGRSSVSLGVVTRRAIAAFFVAPLVAALLYSSISSLSVRVTNGVVEFLATTLAAYIVAGSGTVVLALPVFLLLNRLGLATHEERLRVILAALNAAVATAAPLGVPVEGVAYRCP
jgi:hypothetical protein